MRMSASASSTSNDENVGRWSSCLSLRTPSSASLISLWIRHSFVAMWYLSDGSTPLHQPADLARSWHSSTIASMWNLTR